MTSGWINLLQEQPLIRRVWAMPNKWTFLIPAVSELLDRYKEGRIWADPFSGQSTWADQRNDLNPENTLAHSHATALEFLRGIDTGAV
jgi:hypothetical protein